MTTTPRSAPRAPAPSFKLPTLADETVSLEDYRGRYVLLNFWATWCPPWVRKMPSLPGMMTEQILSGADPQKAVGCQLSVMFLIGGATGVGVLGAVYGGVWRLTDERATAAAAAATGRLALTARLY